MSSIPPSLPPSGPASVPTPPATTATVVNATPAQLAQLASGAVLETTGASSQPASGLVQVQSAAGALLLKLSLPVVDGSTLRLQVVSLGTLPVLRVIAVNGQPLAAGGQPLLTAAKDSLIGAAPLNLWPNLQDLPPPGAEKSNLLAPLDPLRDLPRLTSPGFLATVVRPSGLNAPAALPNGSSFTVRINALQLPDSSGAALPPAFDTPQAAAPPAPPAANSQASRAYAAFASLPLPNVPQPGAPQLAGPTFSAAQPEASPPPPAATTAPALAPSLPGFAPSPANAPDAAQKAAAAPPPAGAAAAPPTATSAPAGQGALAAPPPPSPAITATTDHPLPNLPPTPL
ncbi:MAG TPA: hypothetical protein HPP80_08600, partial [Rhodospirillaceae bacterium]|nr:hypothetical protein [Rhodospirillaceae bacterium]